MQKLRTSVRTDVQCSLVFSLVPLCYGYLSTFVRARVFIHVSSYIRPLCARRGALTRRRFAKRKDKFENLVVARTHRCACVYVRDGGETFADKTVLYRRNLFEHPSPDVLPDPQSAAGSCPLFTAAVLYCYRVVCRFCTTSTPRSRKRPRVPRAATYALRGWGALKKRSETLEVSLPPSPVHCR